MQIKSGNRRKNPVTFAAAIATALMAVGMLAASPAFAALCVWVNPDRDIKKFFPGGDSYTTDLHKYDEKQGTAIEQKIGVKLDPDENEFKFYRVKGKGQGPGMILGTVLTHQARGKYGAVQTVVAIGNDNRIIGVYVQRHREPVNLNLDSFLGQFAGKTVADPIKVGQDIKSIEGQDQSSEAVAFSVRKILVIYQILDGRSSMEET